MRQSEMLERAMGRPISPACGEPRRAVTLRLSLASFLLFAAYYLLKTAREALILTQGGAEMKSYSAFAQTAVLLVLIPLYGALASRLRRVLLMRRIILTAAVQLLALAALDRAGVRIAVAFFVWLGVFNVFATTQLWAFANDLSGECERQRLLPVLGFAGTLGALAGSGAGRMVFPVLAVWQILAAAVLPLAGCMCLIHSADSLACAHCPRQAKMAAAPIGGRGCFEVVLQSRYILMIGFLVLLMNLTNATGEFVLGKMAIEDVRQVPGTGATPAVARQQIGAFYGGYFAYGSLAALFLQAALVSRTMGAPGAGRALLIGPCVSLAAYLLIAIAPGAQMARIVKIAENSVDYTVEQTALNSLFLRMTRVANYKAKTVISTVFYRGGDLLQAVVVLAGTNLKLGVRQFAMVNVFVALVSGLVAWKLTRVPAPGCLSVE